MPPRHTGEGRYPESVATRKFPWIAAFAAMTSLHVMTLLRNIVARLYIVV